MQAKRMGDLGLVKGFYGTRTNVQVVSKSVSNVIVNTRETDAHAYYEKVFHSHSSTTLSSETGDYLLQQYPIHD